MNSLEWEAARAEPGGLQNRSDPAKFDKFELKFDDSADCVTVTLLYECEKD
jgi:hypothetical protein